jgi:hypothetical protein
VVRGVNRGGRFVSVSKGEPEVNLKGAGLMV